MPCRLLGGGWRQRFESCFSLDFPEPPHLGVILFSPFFQNDLVRGKDHHRHMANKWINVCYSELNIEKNCILLLYSSSRRVSDRLETDRSFSPSVCCSLTLLSTLFGDRRLSTELCVFVLLSFSPS